MTRVAAWALAAVAGLVLAVAISYVASTLSSQHVGLSSEPLTAGERLVPHAARPRRTPTPARTLTATPIPPQSTVTAPTATATTPRSTAIAPTATATAPPAGDDSGGDD